MKKRNLQKQIIAAILTGAIAVNACPVAVMAAEIIPEEAEITQQSEETTETEFTEAPEIEAPETETQALLVQAESLGSEVDSVTEFVRRLYSICLDREPDSHGLKDWHDRISSGSISAIDAAWGFLYSKEYQAKQLSDEEFIANLYQLFLNRTGSDAEVQSWLNVYKQGVSKNYLIRGFSNSVEFTKLCSSYGIIRGSLSLTEERDKYPNIAKMVVNCYSILDRTPTGNEINYWVSKTRNGGSGTALVKFFLQSAEYKNLNTGSSDESYIADLYQAFFGRSCNTNEIESWKNKLDNGVSRTYILAQFSASPEFKKTCSAAGISSGNIVLTEQRDKHPGIAKMVVSCYQVLDRVPSGNEIESWVKKTISSDSETTIPEGIFRSKEYSNKNTSNEQYVIDLYKAILSSEPDITDLSDCVEKLENGTSRNEVRRAFYKNTEFKRFCIENGIGKYKSYMKASAVLDKIGWDLNAAFQWSAGMKYSTYYAEPEYGVEYYADYGFTNNTGNCYVMAATFCEMARMLGYDAQQIAGSVPLRSGGYGPHSWVEIEIDGTIYVFDPDFTNETQRNGYQITYGQSGTWIYNRISVMD